MEFRILGPLEVYRNGESLPLGGAKQRGLLAILLLNANEVVSSDRLIDALWGEAPPQTARKALQVHVSQLRKALEPERGPGAPGRVLITRSPGYMLALEPDQFDLTRFDRLASEGRQALASCEQQRAAALLREALLLWRGSPLAEIAFEPFVQPEIARLEELRLAALEDRIQADLDAGRHGEVVGELEGLVTAEPLRERLRAQLMRALYRSGRQADALDAYRRGRDTLVEELGIEPGKELRSLHEAILQQDPSLDLTGGEAALEGGSTAAAAAAAADSATDQRLASDFVGRERELRELEAALERARSGHGSTYLIGGEPGIGKSRLADELAGLARVRGVRVLWGRCWEAGGAPAYWPWVQALRAYITDADAEVLRSQLGPRGPEVTHLLPELRDRFPDLPVPASPESEGARFRLFDATTEFIRRAGGDVPLVLVLDDLHAADIPSLLMLRFIAGELGDAAVLVLATYREVELGPDHPLDATLDDLGRQQGAHLISLRGLDESQVSSLIEASAEIALPRRAVSAIHRGTGGNPLFVEELVQLLRAENRLEEAADEGTVRVRIPQGIHELIGRRLERVSDDCRRTLGVAAVLGRELDLEELAALTRRPVAELLDVLDEAIAQRVMTEVSGISNRLRFSHVLIRDVLYEELGASPRRRLHERAGEALEALHGADLDPHLAGLAHHFFEAGPTGNPGKVLTYARRAADYATGQLAYEEAARLYELGMRVLRTAGLADDAMRCELMIKLGEAQRQAGEPAFRETLLEAARIAEGLGDADRMARAAFANSPGYASVFGEVDRDRIAVLERAIELDGLANPARCARLLSLEAMELQFDPDHGRRRGLAEEALALARQGADDRTLALVLRDYCEAVWSADTLDRRRELTAELGRLAARVDDPTVELAALHSAFLVSCEAGLLGDARNVLERWLALTDRLGQPAPRWLALSHAACLALFRGELDRAEGLAEEAAELGNAAGQPNAAMIYAGQIATIRAEQGRGAEIVGLVKHAAEDNPRLPGFWAGLASVHADLGQYAQAAEIVRRGARDRFASVPRDPVFTTTLALYARPVAVARLPEGADALYDLLLPWRGQMVCNGSTAYGSIELYLGGLAATLGRHDIADEHFAAASAIHEREGVRVWEARNQVFWARSLLDRDRVHEAREHAEHAAALAVENGYGAASEQAAAALEEAAQAQT